MKILALSYLYPNSLYPHYGIFVHNRLRAVRKYHEVKVINPIPWFPGCGRLARYQDYDQIPLRETIGGIEVFHPRFLVIPKFFKFIDSFTYKSVVMPLVEELYKSYPFDIVDLHWTYPDLPTGYAIKKRYKKKMLITLRGKEAFHINEGIGREFLIKKYLLQADAVISLSRELQEMAIQVGVDEKCCSVIRNGVDTAAFYYIDQDECRKRLGISREEKVILSVGSLNYGKGFDRIIKAFPSLIRIDANCKLYIIGAHGPAGDCRKEINDLIYDLDLQDHVCFLGTVENRVLIYWYNAADLFCLASRSEGSPNVLGEALACGCPSIATDVGSVTDILGHKHHGVVVTNNADGVQEGLEMAINCEWDREKIFQYMQSYDWDWCGQKVLPVYESLNEVS